MTDVERMVWIVSYVGALNLGMHAPTAAFKAATTVKSLRLAEVALENNSLTDRDTLAMLKEMLGK